MTKSFSSPLRCMGCASQASLQGVKNYDNKGSQAVKETRDVFTGKLSSGCLKKPGQNKEGLPKW